MALSDFPIVEWMLILITLGALMAEDVLRLAKKASKSHSQSPEARTLLSKPISADGDHFVTLICRVLTIRDLLEMRISTIQHHMNLGHGLGQ